MNDNLKEQYLDGELGGVERQEFEKAMAADPTLREEMERQSEMDQMLRVTMNSRETDAAIVESVMARVNEVKTAVQERADVDSGNLIRGPWGRFRGGVIRLGIAAAIVLGFVFFMLKDGKMEKHADIAVVENTAGRGYVTRGQSARIEMTPGMSLRSGDAIWIEDGLFQYFFVDGEGFELKDGFSGKIDTGPGQDAITLTTGSVRVWPRGEPKQLVVIAAKARVIAKDSKFLVSMRPEGLRVEAWNGRVQVEAAGTGERLTLVSGEFVVVDGVKVLEALPLP